MDTNAIMKSIAQYRLMKAEAEKELEVLEKELKEYMLKNDIDEIVGDEHKATYKDVASTRFDSKSFKSDGYADLYEAYMKSSTTKRFTFA